MKTSVKNIVEHPKIQVKNLTMGYGDFVLQKDMSFDVNSKDIFIVMGGSGCGKSSLLRVLTGLMSPLKGSVYIDGKNFTSAISEVQKGLNEVKKGNFNVKIDNVYVDEAKYLIDNFNYMSKTIKFEVKKKDLLRYRNEY